MEWNEIPQDSADTEGPEFDKIAVECICPKCNVRHKAYLYWVGRGTPRKFCRSCRKYSQNSQFDKIFAINLNGVYSRTLANERR